MSNCPPHNQLLQFAIGRLPQADASVMERHVQTCDRCARMIGELHSETVSYTPTPRPAGDTDARGIPSWALLSAGPEWRAVASAGLRRRTPDDIGPGQRLGQYELLDVLGRGGMGVVLKARHVKLDRVVAMKILAASVVQNQDMLKRFEREMQAVARLDHAHIVRAFDADEIDGLHFMVMEFVDGFDLSALVKGRGPLPIPEACELIRQAAIGLQHVAENGMVHRDLKPGNLMLTAFGQVKLLDLGLALLQASPTDGTELTATGQLMGTIDYISPEQAENTHDVDIRTDIYSLGATLFALLTGHGPFGGKQFKSQFRKIAALATRPAPSLQKFRADVPRNLAQVVARILASDPDDRYQTPQDMIDGLTPFCRGADTALLYQQATEVMQPPVLHRTESQTMQESSSLLRPEEQTVSHPALRVESVPTVSLQPATETNHSPPSAVTQVPDDAGLPTVSQQTTVSMAKSGPRFLPAGLIVLSLLLVALAWSPLARRLWDKQPSAVSAPDAKVEDSPTQDGGQNQAGASGPTESKAGLDTAQERADDAIRRLKSATTDDADRDEVWSLLEASDDPTLRTCLIHQMALGNVNPQLLIDQSHGEQRPSVLAALLMALGEYNTDRLSPEKRRWFVRDLRDWFETHDDALVHSTTEWLLRRWGYEDQVELALPLLQQKMIPYDGGWYETITGHTMVVLPGPVTFVMGSPDEDDDRITDKPLRAETLHDENIPRTIAVATKEVSRQQFFLARPEYLERSKPHLAWLPLNNILWDSAAWYCNRLSLLEGIPAHQFCYEEVPDTPGRKFRAKANALELTGYRMLTDAEWEYVCRAGTTTARYFGHDRSQFAEYGFGADQGQGRLQVPGLRKPNGFGLFDTLGNVSEWIHDAITAEDGRPAHPLRGGSVWTPLPGLRAAARYHYHDGFTNERVGIRVARTISAPAEPVDNHEFLAGPAVSPGTALATRPRDDAAFLPVPDGDVVCLGTWDRGATVPRWFRLYNTDDESMTVTSRAASRGFEFVTPPPTTIAPGATGDFSVQLTDDIVGLRSGTIVFMVNQAGESRVCALHAVGSVHGATAELLEQEYLRDDGVFSFGDVPQGGLIRHSFSIYNAGDRNLLIEDASVPAGFDVRRVTDSPVASYSSRTVRVKVDTSEPGPRSGVLTMQTSDGANPLIEIPLTANVIASPRFSIVGVFRDGEWLLDRDFDAVADERFHCGLAGDIPITGDWNGDGVCDVGICRPGARGTLTWKLWLRSGLTEAEAESKPELFEEFNWASTGAVPLPLDRSGDGTDRAVIAFSEPEPAGGERLIWKFRNGVTTDAGLDLLITSSEDVVITGDWNGDGKDDFGAVSPPDDSGLRVWKFRSVEDFEPVIQRHFGREGDIPVVGDWDADGIDDIGVFRTVNAGRAEWQLDVSGDGQLPEREFRFGKDGDIPVVLSGSQ